ncbi:DUF3592 domain-containing protein [Streptomyces sp. P9(2023)]|uniref:DUF3592 domain-containing protein n=1 Tax=Streptomyces sp. P9(2023) TaxID=3064394 RepID=UPI0028F3EA7C|nr:DUF3592 domain-containing protein [Streptomyces sp. P9(2023)]MDT9688472.1 DUF3592 domain-containing protein [Streptomyces sp. P9(2023)]
MALLAGLTLLGFGTHEVMVQHRLRREGVRVGGRVVHHNMSRSGHRGSPSYFAVVEFVDAEGRRHAFRSSSSGVEGLPVGGHVPVRYLPDAPTAARIDLSRRRTADILLPFMGGGLFTFFGIWMLVTGR